ncbi:unnamed protein product, partial [Prorocentrum cordatum]
DPERPLSEQGRAEAAFTARGVAEFLGGEAGAAGPVEVLHSGKLRAEQTAAAVAGRLEAAGLEVALRRADGLAPNDPPAAAAALLEGLGPGAAVLVGHLPHISGHGAPRRAAGGRPCRRGPARGPLPPRGRRGAAAGGRGRRLVGGCGGGPGLHLVDGGAPSAWAGVTPSAVPCAGPARPRRGRPRERRSPLLSAVAARGRRPAGGGDLWGAGLQVAAAEAARAWASRVGSELRGVGGSRRIADASAMRLGVEPDFLDTGVAKALAYPSTLTPCGRPLEGEDNVDQGKAGLEFAIAIPRVCSLFSTVLAVLPSS